MAVNVSEISQTVFFFVENSPYKLHRISLAEKKRFKTFPHIWATLVSKHRSMHCTAAVGVRFRPGWLSRFEMQISHGYKLL